MFTALFKAIGQLGDPAIRRIVMWSAALAFGVLIALAVAAWLAVAYLEVASLSWLDRLIEYGTGLALIFLCWLLFPAAVTMTIGAYLESVAGAVEANYYPGLPKPREQSLREAVLSGSKFAAVALLLNIVALPIYLAGLFFPPLNFLVFYGLNGYLLGREYFETVAIRRLDPSQARELRRRHKRRVFAAGAIITFLLTIPFVNLIAPVIATAFMVHLVEGMRRPAGETQTKIPGR